MKGDSTSKTDFKVASSRKIVLATSGVSAQERIAQISSASVLLPGSIGTVASSGEGGEKKEARPKATVAQNPELPSGDGFPRLKFGFAKITHCFDTDSSRDLEP